MGSDSAGVAGEEVSGRSFLCPEVGATAGAGLTTRETGGAVDRWAKNGEIASCAG
jgi:hypothetical protein